MLKKWLVASAYATSGAMCALVNDPLMVYPATSFLPVEYLKAKLRCAQIECHMHLTLLAFLLHVLGDHGRVQYSIICREE